MTMALRHRLFAMAAGSRFPRRSIRLRLTAVYGALFLASGAGLLAVTYALVQHQTGNPATVCEQQPNGGTMCAGWRSGGLPAESGQPGSTLASGGHGRVTIRLSPRQSQAVASQMRALAFSQHASEMHWLLVYSGLALAAMAVISVALGWLVAGRMLRPLRTITAAARNISATSLDRRLALTGPGDELKELGDTFDGLLARLEASFRSQRQFVANASHELRTPLAWQRTLVQVALADPGADAGSLRAAHERVLASGAHQERIIDALLTLSRSQAGLAKREPFDLAELAGHVLHARQSDARDRQLVIHPALAPAPATGDPRLAERLTANLVDNALRHNSPGGYVEVVTGASGSQAVLSVINTGPVVPAGAVDRLLQPFQRLGPDRISHGESVGLGLSIVQAIAEAHGAALVIRPRPGGGLRAEVRFPGPAPAAASRVDGAGAGLCVMQNRGRKGGGKRNVRASGRHLFSA
jgi:signal transduction histidine kinase